MPTGRVEAKGVDKGQSCEEFTVGRRWGAGDSEKERGGLRVTGCATGDRAVEGRG